MRTLRLIAAAGALGIAAASPAAAAWSPPERASAGAGDAHSPDVAVNGRGDAVAVWVQETGGRGRVVASTRRAGRPWSRPAPVSLPGRSAIEPRVAVDAAGRIVAAWRQVVRARVLRGKRQAVYVARARERRPGGGWGPVATLSDDRQKVGTPELAIDGRGVAIATWHWGTGTAAGTPGYVGVVQVAEKRAGQPWARARAASRPGGCELDTRLPHVAAGAAGHAVVWWQCDGGGGRSATDAIGRGRAPGAWSAERRLPFGATGDQVADLAVDPAGTVLAVGPVDRQMLAAWRGSAPLGGAGGLDLTRLVLRGVQGFARDAGRPAIAAAPTGSAVAGWILGCRSGLCGGVGVAEIGTAGTVDRVTALDLPVKARRDVRVGAGADGAVAVAVSELGVVAANRPSAGPWTAPELISAAGPTGARLGVDEGGGAVAVWSRRAGGRVVVERAELEAAP